MMSPLDEEFKFNDTLSKNSQKNQSKKMGYKDSKLLNLAGILRNDNKPGKYGPNQWNLISDNSVVHTSNNMMLGEMSFDDENKGDQFTNAIADSKRTGRPINTQSTKAIVTPEHSNRLVIKVNKLETEEDKNDKLGWAMALGQPKEREPNDFLRDALEQIDCDVYPLSVKYTSS